jgi:hypothetical protein
LLAFAADAGAFAALGGQHAGVADVGKLHWVNGWTGFSGRVLAAVTMTDPCFPRRTICSSRRPS